MDVCSVCLSHVLPLQSLPGRSCLLPAPGFGEVEMLMVWSTGFGLGASPVRGDSGTEHPREYRSTQRSTGHIEKPVCEMSSTESSWRGLRLGGAVVD